MVDAGALRLGVHVRLLAAARHGGGHARRTRCRTTSSASAWSGSWTPSSGTPPSARSASWGGRMEVLVEGPSRTDPSRLRGRTRHNKTVNFAGVAEPGELAQVEIASATSTTLAGEERCSPAWPADLARAGPARSSRERRARRQQPVALPPERGRRPRSPPRSPSRAQRGVRTRRSRDQDHVRALALPGGHEAGVGEHLARERLGPCHAAARRGRSSRTRHARARRPTRAVRARRAAVRSQPVSRASASLVLPEGLAEQAQVELPVGRDAALAEHGRGDLARAARRGGPARPCSPRITSGSITFTREQVRAHERRLHLARRSRRR